MSANGGCLHNCINFEGSHECSCRDGFVLQGDNRTCEDVDECIGGLCSHTCSNLPGGFRCDCPGGYTLDADRLSCRGMRQYRLPIVHSSSISSMHNPLQKWTNVWYRTEGVNTPVPTKMAVLFALAEMASRWKQMGGRVKVHTA